MITDIIDSQVMTEQEMAALLREWEGREWPTTTSKYAVQWRSPSPGNPALRRDAALDIADARSVMRDSMRRYFDDEQVGGLIITAQAGIGKSTTAIDFAQEVAGEGSRVLYLMPRHAYWRDISTSPYFDPDMWMHWRATHATDPDSGEPMCKLNKHSSEWMRKGYKLIDMCKSLCLDNGHMQICPYRMQAKTKVPIIAAPHQMATVGLGITNFDLVIVDELPISAFVSERVVSPHNIDATGEGELGSMLRTMQHLSLKAGRGRIDRRDLLKHIAGDLRTVLNAFESGEISLERSPVLRGTNDVARTREWYVPELIPLLIPELVAYEKGLQDWLSRVYIDENGLHMMVKKAPWLSLPPKLIALDATGRPEIYERLFNIPFTAVTPNVRMRGNLYQIARSLNGIGTVLKRGEAGSKVLTWKGKQLLEQCRFIAALPDKEYRRVGVITYKDARPEFEAIFGPDNVLHFGGSRGTNKFMRGERPVDCLIIAGSPAPPDATIYEMASQIWFDPLEPKNSMITLSDDDPDNEYRGSTVVEYPYIRRDGKSPHRLLGGFWQHGVLESVMAMHREDEIRQSAHRGRPLTHNCDVWILSTVPTTDPLDGFYEDYSEILPSSLSAIGWQNWAKVSGVLGTLEAGSYSLKSLASRMGSTTHHVRRYCESWAGHYENATLENDVLTII